MGLIDDTRFPIVVMSLDQAESLSAMLVEIAKLLDAGQRFCLVVDGTRGMKPSLNAVERRAAADFMKKEAPRMQKTMAGLCTASGSSVVRGVITAVQWISPPPVPGLVCGTLEEGLAWASERLNAHAA